MRSTISSFVVSRVTRVPIERPSLRTETRSEMREHLVEPMRHEEDAQALGTQAAQELEEPFRLEAAEAGRGLVEDEDAGALVERPGDLHELLLRGREPVHGAVQVDADAQGGDGLGGLAAHLALVQPPAAAQLPAQEHVLDDREVRSQAELLPDDGDALGTHPGDGRLAAQLAVDVQAAALVGQSPGDDLDERRLARAVLAHERVHLAREELQRRVGQEQHVRAADGPALVVVGVLLDVLRVQQDGAAHVRSPR